MLFKDAPRRSPDPVRRMRESARCRALGDVTPKRHTGLGVWGGAWLDGLLPKLVHCQQRFNELASDRHPGERDCVVIQKCSVQIPRDQVLLPPFLKGDRGGF
ncbi:MAG: hypothetical protein ABSE08_18620, partial [Syntrophobacteraceae bacterium]